MNLSIIPMTRPTHTRLEQRTKKNNQQPKLFKRDEKGPPVNVWAERRNVKRIQIFFFAGIQRGFGIYTAEKKGISLYVSP
jgi:hypothetical protein